MSYHGGNLQLLIEWKTVEGLHFVHKFPPLETNSPIIPLLSYLFRLPIVLLKSWIKLLDDKKYIKERFWLLVLMSRAQWRSSQLMNHHMVWTETKLLELGAVHVWKEEVWYLCLLSHFVMVTMTYITKFQINCRSWGQVLLCHRSQHEEIKPRCWTNPEVDLTIKI